MESDPFLMVFMAVLLAQATWSALTYTLMVYARRRALRRMAAEPQGDFVRIMEAQEELNLAAFDIPDQTPQLFQVIEPHRQGDRSPVGDVPPWLLRLLDAARAIKMALPESHQRATRALARDRMKTKGVSDIDDTDAGP